MVGSSYITWQSERNFDTIAVRGRLTRSRYNRHYGGFQDTLGQTFSFFFLLSEKNETESAVTVICHCTYIFYRKIYMDMISVIFCNLNFYSN